MRMWVPVCLAGLSSLVSAPLPAQDAGMACPEPKIAVPRYPPDAVRAARQGAVMVEGRVDECGRVVEARIRKATRHSDLNDAALAAAQESILPADRRAGAVDGWIAWPIDFKVDSSQASRPVDWPRTHRRARYVLDAPLDPAVSVAALKAEKREMMPNTLRPPVLPLRHEFRQVRDGDEVAFWLFLSDGHGVAKLAARYRTVIEDDGPVVRVAMRCEFETHECADLQRVLVQRGLPMAKPLD